MNSCTKLLIAAAAFIGFSQTSFAATCEWTACASSLTVNSGHTGNQCNGWAGDCAPSTSKVNYCSGFYASAGTNCATWAYHFKYATHFDGRVFCAEDHTCQLPSPEQREEYQANRGLEDTFGQPRDTYSYHGWVDASDKSPSTGRGNSAWAHLDACLGYSKVDTYTNMGSLADNTACRNDCDNPANNGICNDSITENNITNNTNGRCKDRCDCWMNATYGKTYNCENL